MANKREESTRRGAHLPHREPARTLESSRFERFGRRAPEAPAARCTCPVSARARVTRAEGAERDLAVKIS